MGTLASTATGNISSASTLALCDGTSENDSDAATSLTTTSYVVGTTFTPGAITIDAILLKVDAIPVVSGTFTVALDQAGADVAGTVVTVNVADLPNTGTATGSGSSWVCLKFSASVTLSAATAYGVKVRSSVASTVRLKSLATTNWSRQLRTTTTQLAVAGDKILISGDLTGAGAGNNHVVTWDLTSSTTPLSTVIFGSISFLQSISVASRGTLAAATAASTTYGMRFKGILRVEGGGTLNLGTSGTPMPSTSTFTVTLDSTANVDTGIVIGKAGNWVGRGNALTTVWDRLAADSAGAATSLTTASSTGWKNGDLIGLAPTSVTAAQFEARALTADAVTTTLTIAAVTNARSGTNNANGDTRAELANLTRNVKIQGASASLQGYIFVDTTAATDVQYLEFINLGSATATKRGIDVATTTGSFNFQYNSIRDGTVASSIGLNLTGVSGSNFTVSNNVLYNNAINNMVVTATTAVHTIANNLSIGSTTGILLSDVGSTYTDNYAAGASSSGFQFGESGATIGSCTNLVAHTNANQGVSLNPLCAGGTISGMRSWRNGSFGMLLTNGIGAAACTVDGFVAFGNVSAGISTGTVVVGLIALTNFTIHAGASFTQPNGLLIGRSMMDFNFYSGTFGTPNAHATADINVTTGVTPVQYRFGLHNCLLNSATPIANISNLSADSVLSFQKYQQTAGNHRLVTRSGTFSIDTGIFRTASPSSRATPSSASIKLEPPPYRSFRVPVNSGQTGSVGVWVRKSVAGDGTAYNGNQPRLSVRARPSAGIAADVVLMTASGAAGLWEQLTGTTAAVTDDCILEFEVDCDGTLGWINTDDWTGSASVDTRGGRYYSDGFPLMVSSGDSALAAGQAYVTAVGSGTATVSAPAATGGFGPYTYQWQRSTTSGSGFANVGGATSLTLNDTGLTNGTTYYYRVVATDSVTATANGTQGSGTPTAGGGGGSALVASPAFVTGIGNANLTISAPAASGGTSPYTYQWQRSLTAGVGFANVGGATSLSLSDTGLTNGTTYYYRLVTTDNVAATATGAEASGTPSAGGGGSGGGVIYG